MEDFVYDAVLCMFEKYEEGNFLPMDEAAADWENITLSAKIAKILAE